MTDNVSRVNVARLDANGNPDPTWPLGYCSMRGHHERNCATHEDHMALVREGVGFSSVPGPSDAELLEETRNDRELVADEFHGLAPGEWTEMFGK